MLDVQDIKISYGQLDVLKGVNFQVEEGSICGVLGMNGAGKTTLFKTLCGWNPSYTGDVLLNNKTIAPNAISFMETHPYFYPYMTGMEYLKLLETANPHFNIMEWNTLFDLPLNRLVDHYSTGMRKKLAFLGLLLEDRPVLIFDEPFNGVDIESNEKMRQVILRLKKKGKHILVSSHIIAALTQLSDNIVHLSDGKIAQTYSHTEFGDLEAFLRANIAKNTATVLDGLLEI